MLPQETAVQKITDSLRKDLRVKAIFLKGSMGRNEYDEHSDIDLYCLVEKEDEKEFLGNRLVHLQAYRPVIFQDDIFIVAPQLIAVFDDFLHIDLFTVTPETFKGKDFFKVLHDPEDRLTAFIDTQGLELKASEYRDHVNDVAWFLFQYKKASSRGNGIWSVKMLANAAEHLARVLLYRYAPERAQLGLKSLQHALPTELFKQMEAVFEAMTPSRHAESAEAMSRLLKKEFPWIKEHVADGAQIETLLQSMLDLYASEEKGMQNLIGNKKHEKTV
ncbi:nucleotidyltransferase domain-containing protein [Planococcus koreensis]|uniref:nucleotidyltransferase domain-containing protein n=1 Tax=Planococcus koreensis TaxID=112331 RepID=UPI0039FD803D